MRLVLEWQNPKVESKDQLRKMWIAKVRKRKRENKVVGEWGGQVQNGTGPRLLSDNLDFLSKESTSHPPRVWLSKTQIRIAVRVIVYLAFHWPIWVQSPTPHVVLGAFSEWPLCTKPRVITEHHGGAAQKQRNKQTNKEASWGTQAYSWLLWSRITPSTAWGVA